MKSLQRMLGACVVLGAALALACGENSTGGDGKPAVATPSFTPTPGAFTEAQDVEISTTTADATIYYTMTSDGSTPAAPTTASTVYSGPIALDVPANGSTVYAFKAIAVKEGLTDSAVASASYTMTSTIQIVTIADFESGPASYPIIGSATPGELDATVIATGDVNVGTSAAQSGNDSAHVLAVGSDAYNEYVKFAVTLPAGKQLADYGFVCARAIFPNNGGDNQYKNILVFADTTLADEFHASGDAIGTSTSTGGYNTSWLEYCIPLDPTKAAAITGQSLEIALGVSRSGTADGPYYLDDVKLLPPPVLNQGFEGDVAGTTTYPIIGGATPGELEADVIAIGDILVAAGTTGATTGNSSANVLAVGSDGYNEYALLPLTLPEGATFADYAYVRVRAVLPNNGGDNGYKNIYVFVADSISDAYHPASEAVAVSIGTSGTGTAWKEFVIPIDPTKAGAVSGTALQIAVGVSRSGTAAGPYYLDDIALIHE